MKSRVCVLTGATSGIGLLATELLLQEGLRIIIIARDRIKAKNLQQELKLKYNLKLEFIIATLDNIKQLKYIVSEIIKLTDRIDILINNAGIYTEHRQENVDGWEKQFMVNFMAPAYLSRNLMPLLQKSDTARVINVSSRMHTSGKINFNDLHMNQSYSASKAYANSKLALIVDTFFLANQYKNSSISFIAMHPGVYATGITRELPKVFQYLWQVFIPGPLKGAQIVKELAVNAKYKNQSGVYFFKDKYSKAKALCYDIELQKKLNESYNAFVSEV